jgi:hypothetical protein
MKKKYLVFLMLAAVLIVPGCKKKETEVDYTSSQNHRIEVEEEGNVISTLIDVFDKDYYNQEELKTLVEGEIAAYNRKQEGALELGQLQVENQKVTLTMNYSRTSHYSAFNDTVLFRGTISEAIAAGYDFNTTFIEIDNGNVKTDNITANTLKALGDEYQVLITNEVIEITVPSAISYISNNMNIEHKRTASVKAEVEANTIDDTKVFSYVIYK